jgi:hypothetical protein
MTVANVQVTQVLLKRGNTTKSLAYTGPLGEPTMDTDLNSIRIHDGVTPGGHLISGGGGGNYGNVNVAAYLPTYTGNVQAGNVLSNSYLYANGAPVSFSGVTNQLVSGTAKVTLANAAIPNLYMPSTSVIQGNARLTLRSGNVNALSSEIQIGPTSFSISSSDQTDPGNSSSSGMNASGQLGNPTFEITVVDPSSPTSQNWAFDKNGILSLPSGATLYDTSNQSITFGYNSYATPTQGSHSVAIGTFSGVVNQGDSAVAIGNQAGDTSQGAYSIAIGNQAGTTNQASQSIILNANITGLSANVSGFYVNPVRNYYDAGNTIMMVYNTVTKELSYSNVILASVTAARYANANVAAYLPSYAGSISGTVTTATQTNITRVGTLSSLTTGGDATINGNLTVTGNITYTGNVTSVTVTGNSGQFFGNGSGFGALYAGISSGYLVEPQMITQFTSNFNGYSGVNHQNINPGSQASSDIYITADNGTALDGYVDIGMGSSTYNYPGYGIIGPNDAYIYAAGNTTTGGGDLIVGTYLNNDVVFVTNGLMPNNEVMRITAGNVVRISGNTVSNSATSGALTVAGGVGVSGTVTVANTVVLQGVDLLANVSSLANQIVTANTAMKSYVDALNTAMAGNIVTANTALKSYTDTQITAVTTAWTANAATQATELVNLDLKIISANSYAINNVTAANASIQSLSANIGSYYTWANANVAGLQSQIFGANTAWTANAATQAVQIQTLNANIGSYYTWANANVAGLQSQITAANSSIQSLGANIGSYYTWANANVAGLQGQITAANTSIQSLSANVGGFYTYANTTFVTAGSGYSNSNVAAYLPGYSGNVTAGNVITNNLRFANGAPLSFSALASGASVATLSTSGLFQTPSLQSDGTITTQGPVVLTYSGVSNTLYKIAAVDVDNLAIYGTRNTYFDTTLLTLNSASGNATVAGNVLATNYTYANGVNILSTISQLNNGGYTATLNSAAGNGTLQASYLLGDTAVLTQGSFILTYAGVANKQFGISMLNAGNAAIQGTRSTALDTNLLSFNIASGNVTAVGNVVAPNYLFANGVNILSTVGAGTFNGGTVTGTTTFATGAQVFVQNTTPATSTTTGALVVTGGIASSDTIVGKVVAVPFGVSQTATDIQRIILAQTLIA